jgi:hypothetical protein
MNGGFFVGILVIGALVWFLAGVGREKLGKGFSILAYVLSVLALLVGLVFSVAGAGMYGSPFVGKPSSTCLPWLIIVLVSPLALAFATFKGFRLPKATGTLLIACAMASAVLGHDILMIFWWTVYLLLVWIPMLFLGSYLLARSQEGQ